MSSREIEEKNLWKAYQAEATPIASDLYAPSADDLAAYLDRVSEDGAAEKIELYLASSAAGLRTMRDMRVILDAEDGEPAIMPAHIMDKAHAAVRAAMASSPEAHPAAYPAVAGVPEPALSPLAALKRLFNVSVGPGASGEPSSAFAWGAGRKGVRSGLIWGAAVLLMAMVGYFGFTIGEQTGDEGRTARTEKEISRPNLLFSVDEGGKTPDLMPVGYELGVAE